MEDPKQVYRIKLVYGLMNVLPEKVQIGRWIITTNITWFKAPPNPGTFHDSNSTSQYGDYDLVAWGNFLIYLFDKIVCLTM